MKKTELLEPRDWTTSKTDYNELHQQYWQTSWWVQTAWTQKYKQIAPPVQQITPVQKTAPTVLQNVSPAPTDWRITSKTVPTGQRTQRAMSDEVVIKDSLQATARQIYVSIDLQSYSSKGPEIVYFIYRSIDT